MRYMRLDFIDEETWMQLPLEAQHWLNATTQNETFLQNNGELAYAVFSKPTAKNLSFQDSYEI
jgi:hypothetical protein